MEKDPWNGWHGKQKKNLLKTIRNIVLVEQPRNLCLITYSNSLTKMKIHKNDGTVMGARSCCVASFFMHEFT